MKKTVSAMVFAVSGLISLSNSWADSPANLNVPDAHSVPAKGIITLFRVQIPGLGIGAGTNKVDADVIVTLDTDPKTIYTLKLDANPTAQVMAETLREAYLIGSKVTLYRQITGSPKDIVKILMVQLDK